MQRIQTRMTVLTLNICKTTLPVLCFRVRSNNNKFLLPLLESKVWLVVTAVSVAPVVSRSMDSRIK